MQHEAPAPIAMQESDKKKVLMVFTDLPVPDTIEGWDRLAAYGRAMKKQAQEGFLVIPRGWSGKLVECERAELSPSLVIVCQPSTKT